MSRTFRPPRALRPRQAAPPSKPERSGGTSRRIESTFGFVDLAGFTALTEQHGDFDAADMATRFAALARAALGPDDRLIKTLGDAVLVTSPTPGEALDLVDRLFSSAEGDRRLPAMRAGLHHGAAIERDGDVFGAAVNLAARVAAEAYAGEVLVTGEVAEAARERGIPVVDVGPVKLKNVSDVTVLSSVAFMVGAIDSAIDPVCQAVVDRRAAIGQLRYDQTVYWFCSLACAAAFASNPAWHVSGTGSRRR
jgi:class 3 adenylate cyclase/YHS domain-containing protein